MGGRARAERAIKGHSLLRLLPLAVVSAAEAQTCESARPGRVLAIGAGFVAIQTAAIALRHDAWWPSRPAPFHTFWGRSNSQGQDALLHAAVSYQLSRGSAEAWEWACARPVAAAWLGAATSFAMGLPKEVGDGFHANGFSFTDVTAAALGAALPAVHRQWPATRVVMPKVFYWPSAEYRDHPGAYPQIENDYAGMRFFVSVNPARSNGAGAWPDWLGVAVGHGVQAWATEPPEHRWFVTLDVDFARLPVQTRWWPAVSALLDQVHFPAPGVRISQGRVEAGFF